MRTPKTIGASPITLCAALLSIVAMFSSIAGAAVPGSSRDEPGRIAVTAVSGNVSVTMAGVKSEVEVDSSVALPARIVTGSDGMLGLAQAQTSITVAADTDLEIPAEAAEGHLIARLVQHRGNVFYDVAHREVGKLRVETPFLVAVIKGTQFNVAVQEDSTTIALFEGRLEIRTPDGNDVIQLNAGEIAIRSRSDGSIRVVGMDENRLPTPSPRADSAPAADAAVALQVSAPPTESLLGANTGSPPLGGTLRAPASFELSSDAGTGIGADLGLDKAAGGAIASVSLDATVDLGTLGASVSVNAAGIDLGLGAGLDLGAATVDLGFDAGVDLGAASVDLGLDAGVDLGAASVDLGVDTGIDLGAGTVDLGLDTGLDLGGVTADLGLDAGIDLGSASIDLGLDTGLDLGGATADLGLDTGLDLGGGSVDLGLDANLGGIDAGLDAGVDLGAGSVDLDLDTSLGIDLDLDLDLGLGGGAPASPPATPGPPAGGGLGGLLGRLL
jgi:FecR-like protein